jgi:hypothetical protein
MFTGKLDGYDGDTITCTVDGFECMATIHHDSDHGTPWENEDGHGPVTDWMDKDSKVAGYRVLSADGRRVRFYNYAEAIKIAKRDGWDAEPYGEGTKGERAARAVDADFANLKAWCRDEWWYVGVAVTVSKNGIQLTGKYDHACWGIESTAGSFLVEVANDHLSEALDAAKTAIAKLCA